MIMLYAGWKHALYAFVRIAYPDKCENRSGRKAFKSKYSKITFQRR